MQNRKRSSPSINTRAKTELPLISQRQQQPDETKDAISKEFTIMEDTSMTEGMFKTVENGIQEIPATRASRPKSSLPLAVLARQSKERSPVVRNRSQRNLSVNLDATPNFAPDKDDVSSI